MCQQSKYNVSKDPSTERPLESWEGQKLMKIMERNINIRIKRTIKRKATFVGINYKVQFMDIIK